VLLKSPVFISPVALMRSELVRSTELDATILRALPTLPSPSANQLAFEFSKAIVSAQVSLSDLNPAPRLEIVSSRHRPH
jgi:hypothetical protein